jgi:hypothetical protein
MKTSRITLTEWIADDNEYIDVDWPKVQKIIGTDHLNWLLKQPNDACQLVLDKQVTLDSVPNVKLVAEFYDDKILTYYHLMWAK